MQQTLTFSMVIFLGNRNFSGVNKNRSGSNNNTPWRNTAHQHGMKSIKKGVFLFLFPDWSLEGSTACSSALSMEYAELPEKRLGSSGCVPRETGHFCPSCLSSGHSSAETGHQCVPTVPLAAPASPQSQSWPENTPSVHPSKPGKRGEV